MIFSKDTIKLNIIFSFLTLFAADNNHTVTLLYHNK